MRVPVLIVSDDERFAKIVREVISKAGMNDTFLPVRAYKGGIPQLTSDLADLAHTVMLIDADRLGRGRMLDFTQILGFANPSSPYKVIYSALISSSGVLDDVAQPYARDLKLLRRMVQTFRVDDNKEQTLERRIAFHLQKSFDTM